MDEVADVGGERLDPLVLGAAGAAVRVGGQRAAGPDLPVGGGEFGVHGGRQAVRQDAAGGEVLGAFGQRAVDGVVAAEDEGRQRWQAARGEVGGLGDHAGRRMEAAGDGGAARDRGRGDGSACPDEPDAVAGGRGGGGGGRFGGHGQPPCRTRTRCERRTRGSGRGARGDGGRRSGVLRPPPFSAAPEGAGRPRRAVPSAGCRGRRPGPRRRGSAGRCSRRSGSARGPCW